MPCPDDLYWEHVMTAGIFRGKSQSNSIHTPPREGMADGGGYLERSVQEKGPIDGQDGLNFINNLMSTLKEISSMASCPRTQ